jgi:magnesium-transporting ATPase (P-type)
MGGMVMKVVKGLSKTEVEASRKKYGDNVIPDSEPTTFWDEFKETFNDPMIRILLVIVAIMLVCTL